MLKNSWKWLGIILVIYTVTAGLLNDVPRLAILNETIRNLYFHVTMWFSMIILLFISLWYSIKYLGSENRKHDIIALEAANAGVVMGSIGLVTGMLWANFTWGAPWVNDPKLNGAAIAMLIYLAYFVLRGSITDSLKKAKISGIYNIFAYVMFMVFIMVLPRLQGIDSLHPGNGGNPAFSSYDLDNRMRLIFYPAIIGWTLIAIWIMTIRIRLYQIKIELEEQNNG
jgi:heme exporter protein C